MPSFVDARMYCILIHMKNIELIDIVDDNNVVVGVSDVETAHEQKLMHRVAGVLVFDVEGYLYVQSNGKYGKLDLSVGGHVQKGESYGEAAQREMLEEIGLDSNIIHISTFLPEIAKMNHFWAIYKTVTPKDWAFRETDEVKSLEKMSINKITLLMKSDPDIFTYGFHNVMKEFLRIEIDQ